MILLVKLPVQTSDGINTTIRNGQGDLVVMSIETYEKLVGKFELYKLLDEGIYG